MKLNLRIIFVFFLSAAPLFLFTNCSTPKQTEAVEILSAERLINKLEANRRKIRSFEGTGTFLLGAVLDRFFAEYSGFNHFTQTVIRSVDRGEIMRWPPRMGLRRPL